MKKLSIILALVLLSACVQHETTLGRPGTKGENGIAGRDGIQGLQGEQGLQGPAGLDGQTGAQGPKGETGPQGIRGETGERGQAGRDGFNTLLVISAMHTCPKKKQKGILVVTGLDTNRDGVLGLSEITHSETICF